ncbi:hypothetical protein HDE68_000862 [Pedobacter cryoconitis]|uniref:Histidine kinase n=1 Tax=Pedobacter cryoconitis TaxID=188932 RepID=A0A7W8ZJ59_9SPHI|nr:FIST N-terminal domain-containing protein [Pedobacter cryoconitis]MBB5634977.1 hypothetical protein [Pedobacter cryoconitis]
MNVSLYQYEGGQWKSNPLNKPVVLSDIKLALCFSGKEVLKSEGIYKKIKARFPNAEIVMCSTAGEIFGNTVNENSLCVAAFEFNECSIQTASVRIQHFSNSYDAAISLMGKLSKEKLLYVMVFSDGSLVNGSELVKGLNDGVEHQLLITGGLAGDGANFISTLVGLNEQPKEGEIVVIGFYGSNLLVTHGSQGGWDTFGLEKVITRSVSNVLFEIDGVNALDLYKKYLGHDAENLPGSSLLFPLSVTIPGMDNPVVRTILSIDEQNKSMTFAGDVPVGSKVKFMKGNFDRLTAAAATAAIMTLKEGQKAPDFSLLISCVGRKLILGPRTEEELEAVSEVFGNQTPLAGFYAYGEISPFNHGGGCQLHNQTMTITSFYELS